MPCRLAGPGEIYPRRVALMALQSTTNLPEKRADSRRNPLQLIGPDSAGMLHPTGGAAGLFRHNSFKRPCKLEWSGLPWRACR
jgi:hypothetical protein